MTPLRGFVLAGGASRRMGRDKASLVVHGRAMAVTVAEALRQAGCASVTLVTRHPGHEVLGLPLLHDDGPPHPLTGVATALATLADGEVALVAPCDLPGLLAGHLAPLLAAGRPAAARGQPLLARLDATCLARAVALRDAGASATEFAAALACVEVPAEALINANRPGDLPPRGAGA